MKKMFTNLMLFCLLTVGVFLGFTTLSYGQTVVSVDPVDPPEFISPSPGEQLTIGVKITNARNVAGYWVTVNFDLSALRYISSANADYLPAGAFFVPPRDSSGMVTLRATSLPNAAASSSGTLATMTFEVVTFKTSTIRLTDVVIVDVNARPLTVTTRNGTIQAHTAAAIPQVPVMDALPSANFTYEDTFFEDGGVVRTLAFSPDGKMLASGGYNHTINLWNAAGQLLRTLTGHTLSVTSVAFSSDGRLLASSSVDGSIRFWNPVTGEHLRTLTTAHAGGVQSVVFSPDSRLLVSGGRDNMARLWDVQTGRLVRTLRGHTDWVLEVAFSRTGLLASASRDRTIRLWNTQGQHLRTLRGHTDFVTSVAFASTGELVSGSRDGTVRSWNPETGSGLRVFRGHTGHVHQVAVSVNGMLASPSADQTVRLWDLHTGQPLGTLDENMDVVRVAAFSSDGLRLASGDESGEVVLWSWRGEYNLEVLTNLRTVITDFTYEDTFVEQEEAVTALAFSPDGESLTSGGYNRTINSRTITTGQSRRPITGHTLSVTSVAFSSDGRLLASSSVDESIRLWSRNGRHLRTLTTAHAGGVESVVFSPDDLFLASGGRDNTVRLWDPETGRLEMTLRGHTDWVLGVAFSADGRLLASASRDRTIRLWNTQGQHLRTLRGHTDFVTSVAFASTGELVSGSRDRTVRSWNPETGSGLRVFRGHTGHVHQVAVSVDGMLASASADQTVRLWDLQTGEHLDTLDENMDVVRVVAFSSDGRLLASGDESGEVVLWSRRAGVTPPMVELDASVRIPDPTLRACIELVLGKAPGATITKTDMRKLTSLDTEELRKSLVLDSIRDLTGIEFAANLTELDLGDSEISDVSPLAGLRNLTELDLAFNEISDISPLAGLKNLTYLYLNGNGRSDISPLAGLKNLTYLYLNGNEISDISPLAGLKNLTGLYLNGNEISDISPLAGLRNLTYLGFYGNEISDVSPLSGLTSLKTLGLYSNEISDISPLAGLRNLTELDLGFNEISDVSPLAGLRNLTELDLESNEISDISPLAGLRNLTELDLGFNEISDVSPLAGLTNLRRLFLYYNRVWDFTSIAGLVKNLEIYRNSPQLKSLIPHSVKLSGPTMVTSVISDYTFTATVTNASDQGIGGIEVIINSGETVRTNSQGAAKFSLNFPSVGVHDINVTVRDKESGTEFHQNFPKRVEVPKPYSITLVKDFRFITAGSYYTAAFVVQSANGRALEGFQVRLDIGEWEFEVLRTEQLPIPRAAIGTSRATPPDFISDSDLNAPIEEIEVYGWRVSPVPSNSYNTGFTNNEGKVICNQRPLSAGLYGVSATVFLDGQEFLTTSFSDKQAPNRVFINPGKSVLNERFVFYYQVSGGWKLLGYFIGDPPSYRVKVVPRQLCGSVHPSSDLMSTADKLAPLANIGLPSPPIYLHSPLIEESEEIYPDPTRANSTTSMHPNVRWTPLLTRATDVGVTVITVKFLDGTDKQIEQTKAAFNQWESESRAKIYFRFVEKEDPADIRVTFDINNVVPRPRGTTKGRATIGNTKEIEIVGEQVESGALDRLGASLFDWAGYTLESVKWQLQKEALEQQHEQSVQDQWTLWLEDTLEGAWLHGIALHEIGHALGFFHVFGTSSFAEAFVWPPPPNKRLNYFTYLTVELPDTAEVDQYSIMNYSIDASALTPRDNARKDLKALGKTGITEQWNTLSPGDKKAVANVYGRIPYEGWEVRHITGTMSFWGKDDEIVRNEYITKSNIPVDIYVGPQDEAYEFVPFRQFQWGGELRVEIEIGARGIVGGDVEMAVRLRLYEGTHDASNDLDGETVSTFLVSDTQGVYHIGVYNVDEGGDRATVNLELRDSTDTLVVETLPSSEDLPAAPSTGTHNLFSASDVNEDEQINVADLVLVSNAIGQSNLANVRLDVNGDGFVTIADLIQVAQYLGQSTYSSAPAQVVVPAGLTHETVQDWIDSARLEDDGSLVFRQGIAKLEYLLTLIIPEKTALLANYPNPFNPETWIPYHLSEPAEVALTIYSIDGKVVRHLDLGHQPAGFYQSRSRAVHWDGRNNVGERVASGIYFYTFKAGDFSTTRKMLIRK